MSVARRIARLLQQSRIRLPRAPVRASELRPGSWVQLGARTWRVATRRFEAKRVVFRLRSVHGRAGAVLIAPRSEGRWRLEEGKNHLDVPPELLVVFPVI